MQVPEPVYINPVPNTYINGPDYNYVITNPNAHVDHNQRAYARYEATRDAIGQAPTGRAAMWWAHESMPYTTDIASTGVTESELHAFINGCAEIIGQGQQQVFSLSDAIFWGLCFGYLCIPDPRRSCYRNAWSQAYIGQRLGQYADSTNDGLRARGVRGAFRVSYVPGMGMKYELHHTA